MSQELEVLNETSSSPKERVFSINELFGPTIQGEGAVIGAPTHFVRLNGCDFRCVPGDTEVLLFSGGSKPIAEILPGDVVVGFGKERLHGPNSLRPSIVLHQQLTGVKEVWEVTCSDGSRLRATNDHEVWVTQIRDGRVWQSPKLKSHYKPVKDLKQGMFLKGPGSLATLPLMTDDVRRGYLCGMMNGDGHVGLGWIGIGLTDQSIHEAVGEISSELGVFLHPLTTTKTCAGTALYKRRLSESLREEFLGQTSWRGGKEFALGYLAGMFDAEGHIPGSHPYISNKCHELIDRLVLACEVLERPFKIEWLPTGICRFHLLQGLWGIPIRSKAKNERWHSRGLNNQRPQVESVRLIGEMPVYDISTSTGNFLADGFVIHNCSWCDSLRAVLPELIGKHHRPMTAQQIVDALNLLPKAGMVTLSGGNPGMHAHLGGLVHTLQDSGWKVCVETQGSIPQPWFGDVDYMVFSPKPPSSGMVFKLSAFNACIDRASYVATQGGRRPQTYERNISNRISIKVVVFDCADLHFAREMHRWFPEFPFYLQVGTRMTKPSPSLREMVVSYQDLWEMIRGDPDFANVRLLPQFHKYIFGHGDGV